MPYIENATQAKLREIRNAVDPVTHGVGGAIAYYEVQREHFLWLIQRAEKAEKLQEQLDAKIVFANDGTEEDRYALQARVEELEAELLKLKEEKQ